MDFMAFNAQGVHERAMESTGMMVHWIDEMLQRMTLYPADSAVHSQRDALQEARKRAVRAAAYLDGANIILQRASTDICRILRDESEWK